MIIRHPTENRTWEAQKPCVFATSFDNQEAKKSLHLLAGWNVVRKNASQNILVSGILKNGQRQTLVAQMIIIAPLSQWKHDFSPSCVKTCLVENEKMNTLLQIQVFFIPMSWFFGGTKRKKKKTLKKGDVLSLHHTKDHEDLLGTIGIALFQCTPLFPCNASREHLSLRFLQKVVSLLEKFCGAFLKVVFSLSVTGWFETYSYKKTGMLN